jgi:hypothetical protein
MNQLNALSNRVEYDESLQSAALSVIGFMQIPVIGSAPE